MVCRDKDRLTPGGQVALEFAFIQSAATTLSKVRAYCGLYQFQGLEQRLAGADGDGGGVSAFPPNRDQDEVQELRPPIYRKRR